MEKCDAMPCTPTARKHASTPRALILILLVAPTGHELSAAHTRVRGEEGKKGEGKRRDGEARGGEGRGEGEGGGGSK